MIENSKARPLAVLLLAPLAIRYHTSHVRVENYWDSATCSGVAIFVAGCYTQMNSYSVCSKPWRISQDQATRLIESQANWDVRRRMSTLLFGISSGAPWTRPIFVPWSVLVTRVGRSTLSLLPFRRRRVCGDPTGQRKISMSIWCHILVADQLLCFLGIKHQQKHSVKLCVKSTVERTSWSGDVPAQYEIYYDITQPPTAVLVRNPR
jgi:hypothetical protein